MNIIEYLVRNGVASEQVSRRLWQSQSVTVDGKHPTLDTLIRGDVRIHGRVVEESLNGRRLDEDEARSYLSRAHLEGNAAYVLEGWITEDFDMRKYDREPNIVVFDSVVRTTPWSRRGFKGTLPIDEARIRVGGHVMFYTITEDGAAHIARFLSCPGAEFAVRSHNLFGTVPEDRYA
ncbi:MAG: hypothetical protein ACMXYM_05405 [Candidatus Woesearchaeota archaeon]